MTHPLDAIMAFHNAFRADMRQIDLAALENARGKPAQMPTIERFRFFNDILVIHATGEEQVIYPLLEGVAPLVAEAYVMDHHGLDAANEALAEAVSAGDPLQTARASAAFKFHLDLHLAKEDAHLYRLFRERIALPEQAKAVAGMAAYVPQERFPEAVNWLFSLIGQPDRENMLRIWMGALPAPVFAGIKQLVIKTVGPADWAELTGRIPELL